MTRTSLEDVLPWSAGASAELGASVVQPDGPPGGMYDDPSQDGRGRVTVYLPTARPPRTGRVHPMSLPAAEFAVAVHDAVPEAGCAAETPSLLARHGVHRQRHERMAATRR